MRAQSINKKIENIFEIVRDEITVTDYPSILFLLSAYVEGVISSSLENIHSDTKYLLLNECRYPRIETFPDYNTISKIFINALEKMRNDKFISICTILSQIDRTELKKCFADIFDNYLFKIIEINPSLGGLYSLPNELIRVMSDSFKSKKGIKIFDPFAGLGSFGIVLTEEQEYNGQEANQLLWAIGRLRLMAHGKHSTIDRYNCENSLVNWPSQKKYFDFLITNPPLGTRLQSKTDNLILGSLLLEEFIIYNGLDSLNDDGELIILLSMGFLYNQKLKSLRQFLIQRDLIDTLIFLPSSILKNTQIPLVILFINKSKLRPGFVRFIDATNFAKAGEKRLKLLDADSIINLFKSDIENRGNCYFIKNEEIVNNDYNLQVPQYFNRESEGIELSEILEPINSSRSNLEGVGKIIKISDLKGEVLDFKIKSESIQDSEFKSGPYIELTESCLLLSSLGNDLKPTFLESTGEPTYIERNFISAFRIDSTIVDTFFLISELQSDYVKKQIIRLSFGSVIRRINSKDILSVRLLLPSLEEQRSRIIKQIESLDVITKLKMEQSRLREELQRKKFEEIASLKHTLGRPRQNILDWAANLIDFFNEYEKETSDITIRFKDFYGISLCEAIGEIKKDIGFITEVLERGEKGFELENYIMQPISLQEINDLIINLSSNGYSFQLRRELPETSQMPNKGVRTNLTLLRILFENILTNAQKYAFDENISKREVFIKLSLDQDFLFIEISNNGKPFPKNYNREKFITKYSTSDKNSGSGLGGYDINRIANYFNNPDWELDLQGDIRYSVKFKFHFPLIELG